LAAVCVFAGVGAVGVAAGFDDVGAEGERFGKRREESGGRLNVLSSGEGFCSDRDSDALFSSVGEDLEE